MRTSLFSDSRNLTGIVIRVFLPFVAVTLLAILLIGDNLRERTLSALKNRISSQVSLRLDALSTGISDLKRDIAFLKVVPPVQGMVRASVNGGFDAQENDSLELWQQRMTMIFTGYVSAHPEVIRLRFIGVADNGRELVRVERREEKIIVTPAEELQAKGDKDYVRETSKLSYGEVYLSNITLGQDHGKIAIPHVPTLRIATPIFEPGGKLFGVLVISSNVERLFSRLTDNLPQDFEIFLTNSEGDYLIHPNKDFTFGFDLGVPHRWQDDYTAAPDQEKEVQAYEGPNGIIHSKSAQLHLDDHDPKRVLTLRIAVSDSLIADLVLGERITLASLLLGLGLVVCGLVYLYSRKSKDISQERARLAAIVESSNDGIIGATLQGVVTNWNQAAEGIFQYTAQEAIGQTVLSLIVPPENAAEERDILAAIAMNEAVPTFNTVRRRRDGSLVHVSVVASPIRDITGQIIGAAKTVRDISLQVKTEKRLQESEERLRFALEIAQIGEWDMNLLDRRVHRSPRHDQIYGYDSMLPRWTYEMFLDHIFPQDRDMVREKFQIALANHQDCVFECRIVRGNDQAVRWIRGRGKHYFDAEGTPYKIIGVVEDITEQKLTELRLLELNETLEEQVVQRTAQIEKYSELQRAILTNAGYAIIATDLAGVITVFNPAAERMLGYTAQEMVGLQTPAIIHDPLEVVARAEEFSAELGMPIEPGFEVFVAKTRLDLPNEHEWTYIRKDGSPVPVRLSITSLKNNSGEITSFLGMALDISQHHKDTYQMLTLANHFKKAAEVAELGIWTWNIKSNTLHWNDKMMEIYSVPREMRAKGVDYEYWKSCLHPDDLERTTHKLAGAIAGTDVYDPTFRIVRPDGNVRHIQAAAILESDEDGKVTRMLGINRDVTQQIENEKSLRDAKTAADAASRTKSDFLANMSHEIRTPMNAIIGMQQLLSQTEMDDRQQDYVDKTKAAARSLLGILNDILDFSKVEAGKLSLDPHALSVDELLRDISVVVSANLDDRNVEVVFEIDRRLPEWIWADGMRLQQVLINLTGNALKFTEHGEVVVSARLEHHDNRPHIAVSVSDTGIGIAPEKCKQIFEGFVQAESSTTRRYGGTGLGLAISQRLVRLMGGEIVVESVPGFGSNFHFSIPCQEVPPLKEMRQGSIERLRGLRALVVDDNECARRIICGMGLSFDWDIAQAASGAEALKLMNKSRSEGRKFDIVFIDWRMPGMDGLQTAEYIRELFPDDETPLIVMVTAYGREVYADRQRQIESILNGFLVKPITPLMLIDAVVNAQSGSRPGESVKFHHELPGQSLAGLRLLVVDDNLTNMQIADELLSSEGATVETVDNGLGAIAIIKTAETPFDAVLMDIQMPGMDGHTATREIRNVLGRVDLPVIAMTANAMQSDREAALAAGMNDHVAKPFDLKHLVKVICTHVGRNASEVTVNSNSSSVTTAQLDAVSELDAKTALDRFSGNVSIYQQALYGFAAEARTIIEQLPDLMRTGERADVRRSLHTLKGLAGTVGATALAELAQQYEDMDAESLSLLLPALRNAMQQATLEAEKLAMFLEAHWEPEPNDDSQGPQLLEGLRELAALLKGANMEALEMFEQLRSRYANTMPTEFEKLGTAVGQLAFEEAWQVCGAILQQQEL